MFEHYSIDGSISELSKEEAFKKMNEISQQWEDELTNFGRLYMGVYDWAYKENPFELLIPNLRTGGAIPKNEKASQKFGFDIYGDCFLKL
ncbi:MAG: hypothetical protein BGO31_04275 [Bacteroidetes bacterium 43-16]|nr:MAG: hypothetical protein BGO31_04275 [Bacteroidetes bacterium 43-16]